MEYDAEYMENIIKHKPLYINDKNIFCYRNGKIYIYDCVGTQKKIKTICIDKGFKNSFLSGNRYLRRLLRLDAGKTLLLNEKDLFVSLDGKLIQIDIDKKKIVAKHYYRKLMRNPLALTLINNIEGFENQICYGEYFNNPNKDEISIYRKKANSGKWEKCFTFEKKQINHIHAIIPDEINQTVWIFTGDFGDAAGIWKASCDFGQVVPVVRGEQKYRACVGFPTKDGLLYATDTQFEKNSIRILRKRMNEYYTEKLFDINGPCIYGGIYKKTFVFSTSVEPGESSGNIIKDLFERKRGPGVIENSVHIVAGNMEIGFKLIDKIEKDFLPLRLFQFGTAILPAGRNNTEKLIIYPIATAKHDSMMISYCLP